MQREMYISLGAALENTLIAAGRFKLSTDVKFTERNGVCSINIDFFEGKKAYLPDLFDEIERRFTDRSLFQQRALPSRVVQMLQKLPIDEDCSLYVLTDDTIKSNLAEALASAASKTMQNELFRKELAYWIRNNFTKLSDGFSIGLPDIQSLLAPFLMHEFNLENPSEQSREAIMLHHSSGVICISTKEDTLTAWIKAGQLFERTVLQLGTLGVHHSIHAAMIEQDGARKKLASALKTTQFPQVFLRVGYSKLPIIYSPRRDVAETIR
jgi:hypothetical protein